MAWTGLLALALVAPCLAGAADPPATVVGGADASGHRYEWTITNHADTAIVAIRFPHYRASAFDAPTGWTKSCTYLVDIGVPDKPGICEGSAESPNRGVAPGASARFGMQIGPAGAPRGTGAVRIEWADGTTVTISGVELPTAPSTLERYTSLLALGSIFAVFLLIRALRSRATHSRTNKQPP